MSKTKPNVKTSGTKVSKPSTTKSTSSTNFVGGRPGSRGK